ncbi:hypothetical protein [Aurantimonas sp. 22II-16-19i]|uniref:hypothetical protein n=1 Tax=Aurantimonas sp. 22II-16-19i TaxID=1317114 RepID=UPI0009F7C668|nr:hypothetical protein [Aurantimonas sp. 22II-16-19i]ORE89900.1 hypothetical protein ATO4_22785 [Aurantimonas sp. 22II-16-19i]
MRQMLAFAIVLSAAAANLSPAGAQPAGKSVPPSAFVDPLVETCFARSYSPEHMRSHPRQTVTDIAVIYRPVLVLDGVETPQWDASGPTTLINVAIAVRVRGGPPAPMLGFGYCQPTSRDKLDCGIDEDGGQFSLRRTKGGYMLENPDRLLVMPAGSRNDDGTSHSVTIARADDNGEFLVKPGKGGLCDAKYPAVNQGDWN